jgi:adenylyltransferase/sulfurtransferase
MEAVSAELEGPLTLVLERDLVVGFDCPRCGWRKPVMRPRAQVSQGEGMCPSCGQMARPLLVSEVASGDELTSRSLAELGIPAYDIVRVDGASQTRLVLLTEDSGVLAGWS